MLKKQYFLLLILLILVTTSFAQHCVILSSDKTGYLIFEPVYLSFELIPGLAPDDLYFGSLENETTTMTLEIIGPDKIRYLYRPPVHLSPLTVQKRENSVEFCTLILSASKVVTASPGRYLLRLIGYSGMGLSNALEVIVKEPDNDIDRDAVSMIIKKPIAYALFVYLEGGDHIVEGLAAVRTLAEGNSSYAPVARTIMAIDYSQISYDTKNEKIRRDIDVSKALQLFPEPFDDKIPVYLKLKAVSTALEQIPEIRKTNKLKAKMASLSQRFENDKAMNSGLYKMIRVKQ